MAFVVEDKAQKKAEDGKPKHMQLDGDLHGFLKLQSAKKGYGFREFGNKLLRMAIKQYIIDNKLSDKVAG